MSDAQLAALLIVAGQYGLNPWTKEIYAFPDKKNGIVPVVGVDGWSRIINDHPQFDGMEFRVSENMVRMPGANVDAHEWMECIIYRKDRSRPTVVRLIQDGELDAHVPGAVRRRLQLAAVLAYREELHARRNRFITESSAEFADAGADEVAELLAEAKRKR